MLTLRILLGILFGLSLVLVIVRTTVRFVHRHWIRPMPHFLASAIDNPWRHRIQPPEEMAARHGLHPGMTVLDIGPGNGTYTLASARRVGPGGKVIALDIQPQMIDRVRRKASAQGVENIEYCVANARDLPFMDGAFDAIYMIGVFGEVPNHERALREFHRVLRPGGSLAFTELVPDPDYVPATTLVREVGQAGFHFKEKVSKVIYYTSVFGKTDGMEANR